MLVRFAYGKITTKGGTQSYSPATPITTYINGDAKFEMLGASTLAAAPSTLISDVKSGSQYVLNKPFSAVHAALTAVTSVNDSVNLI